MTHGATVHGRVSMPVIAAVAACLAAVVRNLVGFGARSHGGALFAPGHSGSKSPGRRYESSRHGLAASRPRTPGSGAMRSFHRHEAFQPLWDTPHCEMQRGGPVAPLPVRHPGPRVTAAGCCTPAPSGPATTAAQSGQRHASYHPPRPIMSAARDKMLSTPCRARLRAARHYRFPARPLLGAAG